MSALFALRTLIADDRRALTEYQARQLNVVERALEEQLDLLGDFLDFSKHERGVLPACRTVVALDSVVNEVVERRRARWAKHSPVEFRSGGIPAFRVRADPAQLRRIVENLLTNAFKFTRFGEVRIDVTARGRFVEISVSDTGIGVPAGKEGMLFREFTRLENSSGTPGCGLGLSVAKALAERNEGYLRYERQPGGGSAFVLGLEAAYAVSVAEDKEKSGRMKKMERRELSSVLIVEDDPFAAQAVVRLLQDRAGEVAAVSTVRDAKGFLREHAPELIIVDALLPDGSGVELAREIAGPGSPVILVLSGMGSGEVVLPEKLSQRASVAQRPISRSELEAFLDRHFVSELGVAEKQSVR
jgi:CheY-like chemotaxis protein